MNGFVNLNAKLDVGDDFDIGVERVRGVIGYIKIERDSNTVSERVRSSFMNIGVGL